MPTTVEGREKEVLRRLSSERANLEKYSPRHWILVFAKLSTASAVFAGVPSLFTLWQGLMYLDDSTYIHVTPCASRLGVHTTAKMNIPEECAERKERTWYDEARREKDERRTSRVFHGPIRNRDGYIMELLQRNLSFLSIRLDVRCCWETLTKAKERFLFLRSFRVEELYGFGFWN